MLKLNFTPFPILETERIILRKISLKDAPALFTIRANPDVMKYIAKPVAKEISEVKSLINKILYGIKSNNSIAWGIVLRNQENIIGTVSFHNIEKAHFRAEIGYHIHPDFWNKGILSEILPSVIDYGFNKMKLHSIEAQIDPENVNSKKLLLKNNFIKEAYYKGNYFFNEQFLDTEVYSLLKPNQIFSKEKE